MALILMSLSHRHLFRLLNSSGNETSESFFLPYHFYTQKHMFLVATKRLYKTLCSGRSVDRSIGRLYCESVNETLFRAFRLFELFGVHGATCIWLVTLTTETEASLNHQSTLLSTCAPLRVH